MIKLLQSQLFQACDHTALSHVTAHCHPDHNRLAAASRRRALQNIFHLQHFNIFSLSFGLIYN